MKRGGHVLAILAVTLIGGAQAEDAPESTASKARWSADHHMHLGSVDLCQRLGDCLESNQPAAVYASDLVNALDRSGISRGLAISSAYLYGWNELGLDTETIATLARRENEFTAAEVRQFPGRLAGFLSVDPLEESATEEIEYWRNSPDLAGVKLHLFASEVNLRDAVHLAKLQTVVRQAALQGMPLLVHVGGGDFGGADADIFIGKVLPAAGNSWIQVAHAGGGFPLKGDNLLQVLQKFGDHIKAGNPFTRRVLFDLSYIPAPDEQPAIIQALVAEIRRIGIERFLFGSDFNVLTPEDQMQALDRLQLTDPEMQTLRSRCAPWVCDD